MEKFNLQEMKLAELDSADLIETNGGIIAALLLAAEIYGGMCLVAGALGAAHGYYDKHIK
ncbi:hypothetical protein [Pedobacter jamesrossensis]|uniref:Class IIb bacteriocin, lactobin A/cerein 7B family n=1 Tax=Pedobacter jamesrossensis TaxID=1908238 RepID=A0ABV8NR79_9SPHI